MKLYGFGKNLINSGPAIISKAKIAHILIMGSCSSTPGIFREILA